MNRKRFCPQVTGLLLTGLASLGSSDCVGGGGPPLTRTHLEVFVDFTEVEENLGNAYLGSPSDGLGTWVERLDEFLEEVAFIDKPTVGFAPGEIAAGAGTVTFYPLYDSVLSGGREKVATLDAPRRGGTPFMRRNQETDFREEVREAYQQLFEENPTKTADYPETYILEPMCRFLDRLPDSYAPTAAVTEQWRVVLFSDMVENSNVFSFHTDGGKNDQDIVDIFQANCVVSVSPAVASNMTISVFHQTPTQDLPREKRLKMEELILRAEPIWKQFFAEMNLEVTQYQ